MTSAQAATASSSAFAGKLTRDSTGPRPGASVIVPSVSRMSCRALRTSAGGRAPRLAARHALRVLDVYDLLDQRRRALVLPAPGGAHLADVNSPPS